METEPVGLTVRGSIWRSHQLGSRSFFEVHSQVLLVVDDNLCKSRLSVSSLWPTMFPVRNHLSKGRPKHASSPDFFIRDCAVKRVEQVGRDNVQISELIRVPNGTFMPNKKNEENK